MPVEEAAVTGVSYVKLQVQQNIKLFQYSSKLMVFIIFQNFLRKIHKEIMKSPEIYP